MVKKASRKWRMCMDFTDLNKACPKDSYPLPRVDVLVDSTVRHQFIREVYYPDWLANVVMVKKASRKWRMCVDFTTSKKHAPRTATLSYESTY